MPTLDPDAPPVARTMHPELARAARLSPAPDLSDVPAVRRRLQLQARVVASTHGANPPPGLVVADREVVAERPGGLPVPVRCYDPSPGSQHRPALLFVHGGGFVLGDLETEHSRCCELAVDTGMVVVSVGYRLAPEWPYPAAFEDCCAVMRWLADGSDLGVDPSRVGLVGISAGGALVLGV
ncbi:MAG TPA: alpha/beta hydrolase fold domain-containing protein, partial [Iamia sp.]|nr:alpha/beta hydrolase fold domain-containing protein [Iamia sp.]